jgi:diaminohydroxyphosphoribosylaminopyrimidine deaminase/5-amino-6-(5-phosphoribosylamino)uracil reductase
MNRDETYMLRCIDLALKGLPNVAPNPMVGAILVYDDRVIGEGYHMQFGQPHAEVNCLNSVKDADLDFISQSTLYVSLEPCNHQGKTPPCTDLIIKNKIPRIVIGCKDPFEKVNGTGIQKLREAGIEVETGVLENKAIQLNKRFFTFHQQNRPYIILKWAQSKDGFIAASHDKQTKISNAITDKLVHQWRSEESGIIVGTNTVIADNPKLTVRHVIGKNPTRVFFDRNLLIDPQSAILDGSAPTIIFNLIVEKNEGLNHYVKLSNENYDLIEILKSLHSFGLMSILVEGGSKLLQSLIDNNIWDEARVITNTELHLFSGIASPVLKDAFQGELLSIKKDSIAFYQKKNKNGLLFYN